MEKHVEKKVEVYKSESSIFSHENAKPKKNQPMLPTWSLIVILFICFFALKTFIYIVDKKRQGK
jgi:hypothetical protein